MRARKILRISLGVFLVILGIIGGFIPILQGWMFGIPGLIILSEYFPGVRRLLEWAKAKAKRSGGGGSKDQGPPPDEESARR